MFRYQREPSESESPDNDAIGLFNLSITPYNMSAHSYTDQAMLGINNTRSINNDLRYTAYSAVKEKNYLDLFCQDSVEYMSDEITKRLAGVHPEGKRIVVPDSTILSVADSFFQTTQYTLQMLREMVILHIVHYIKNDYNTMKKNDGYNAWVMKYDMNTGLAKTNDIKINQRERTYFYNWNY